MTNITAVNNFVWVIRDEKQNEASGLILPDSGKEKPNTGTILSVGELVQDKKIKKDKKCLFYKGAGMEVEYNGETYLVIEGERIIGLT